MLSFIVRRTVSTQFHEQRPQIGRRDSFPLVSRATLATTARPINPTKMKTPLNHLHTARFSPAIFCAALVCTLVFSANVLRADETCSSPYLARIDGQEEFVYVWTLGVEGMGDGSDKLVTVDVKPGSPSYGKVVSSSSVDGRNEAHHGGFTDDPVSSGWPGWKAAAFSSSMSTPIRRSRS